jgi:polar amino acid transport system substrate-binding protein
MGQAADVIVFNSSYSPPYSRPDEGGILDRILKEACDMIGVEARVQMLPAERALRGAQSGSADGVVARVEGIDSIYPSLVQIPEAVIESRDFVAFSTHPENDIGEWRDLSRYTSTYVRGWKIIEVNVPDSASTQPVGTTRQAFELLKKGRTDVVINARLDGLRMASLLDIPDIHVHEPPLISLRLYPYVNRDHSRLVVPLAEALARMKATGRFQQIYDEILREYSLIQ